MRSVIVERYEAALQACEAFPNERVPNRVMVLTRYASFLMQDAHEGEKVRLSGLNREAWELIKEYGKVETASGEWFERFGDRSKDHSEAAVIYLHGVRSMPQWHTSWFKWAGASSLANKDTQAVLKELKGQEEGKLFKDFCLRLKTTYAKLTSSRNFTHIEARIKEGFLVLEKACPS
jgi:hypothetical protein